MRIKKESSYEKTIKDGDIDIRCEYRIEVKRGGFDDDGDWADGTIFFVRIEKKNDGVAKMSLQTSFVSNSEDCKVLVTILKEATEREARWNERMPKEEDFEKGGREYIEKRER